MQENRRLLIVEDEQAEIDNVSKLLTNIKVSFHAVKTLAAAYDALANEAFDYLLTDLHIETKAGFDKPDGLQVIANAREQQPNLIIVANSSDPRADIWAEALNAGAQQFIRKPISKADELTIAFGLAKERKLLTGNLKKASKLRGQWIKYAGMYPEGIVIDKSTNSKAKGLAKHFTTSTVLVGETGTGKEELAKLIHKYRCQVEGQIAFVVVNCSTITGNLAESTLFGHRKGSFTGADHTTQGYVAEADGGILFLDEIHSLEMIVQQKLLRVLNDGAFNRLGETKTYKSQFQLVAASTRDLDDEVDEGRFLIDLRNRIMGVDILLKPLRDRKEDIDALVALFFSKRDIIISDKEFFDLAKYLKTFYWRGNIRQLFKALESWILNCEFEELPLTVENFPVFKGMMAKGEKTSVGYSTAQAIMQSADLDMDFEDVIFQFEKLVINNALKRHGSIQDACKALNIARSTFDSRRKKFGLI